MDAAEVARRAELLITQMPPNVPLDDLARQGEAFRKDLSFNNARIVFHAMIKLTNRHPRALVEAGVTEIAAGNHDVAVKLLNEARPKEPNLFAIPFNLGNALMSLDRFEEAIEAYNDALRIAPDHGKAILMKGGCYWNLRKSEEALAQYRLAASLPKFRAHALARIINEMPDVVTDEELDFLRKEASAKEDVAEKGVSCFALGEALDRKRQYDEAFKYYAEGNRLRRNGVLFSTPRYSDYKKQPRFDTKFRSPEKLAQERRKRIERLHELFPSDIGRELATVANDSAKPIFVLGLPRSGSTLIEQVLAAHPLTGTVGESGDFNDCVVQKKWPLGFLGEQEWVKRTSQSLADLPKAAKNYLDRLDQSAPEKIRCVDKSLDNFWYVGLILALFPKATIVHSYRHPLDHALGLFRVSFARAQECTYSLTDIGLLYRDYREIMAYWDKLYPGRIFHQANEDLATDPENGARKLVTACGLEWDDACLRFYESKRVVRTASKTQVRQAISTARLERWRNYEKHLAPFAQAVGQDLLDNWRVETWDAVKSH